MELQTIHGVMIRPGTLILQILLALQNEGYDPEITLDEVLAFALPIKQNFEWPIALTDIKSARDTRTTPTHSNNHARRNVRTWFRLLTQSDFFISRGNALSLSPAAIAKHEALKKLCDQLEDFGSFWSPTGTDDRVSWFRFYGSVPAKELWGVLSHDLSEEYLAENYVGGIDEDLEKVTSKDTDTEVVEVLPTIVLGPVTQRQTEISPQVPSDAASALRSIRNGVIRRKVATNLHDEIIKKLSNHFSEQGALVQEDRNSVDLFVSWDEELKAIFEVKTVSPRNISNRLRLCVGQLFEYAYRYKASSDIDPDKIAVVNIDIPETSWIPTYLNNYLGSRLIQIQ